MRIHLQDQSTDKRLTSADFPQPPVEGEILIWAHKRYRVQRTEWLLEPKTAEAGLDVSMRVVVTQQIP